MPANYLFVYGPVELSALVVAFVALNVGAVSVWEKTGRILKRRKVVRNKSRKPTPVTEPCVSNTVNETVLTPISESDMVLLKRFLDLLSEHVCDFAFTVDCYSNAMCKDRSTLFDHIHNLTGLSAFKIIFDVRLRISMMLLAQTDLGMAEVSSVVGYAEVSSFCFKFKQKTGMTATQFRKGWRSGIIEKSMGPLEVYELGLIDGSAVKLDLWKIVSARM